MLSAQQQERYARHLLLDGFDQERLLAARVRVFGTGLAARWAARYLAASGVGSIEIEEPAWAPVLRALGPWADVRIVQLVQVAPPNVQIVQLVQFEPPDVPVVQLVQERAADVPVVQFVQIAPADGASPAESAMNGAQAALEAIREIAA